MPPILPRLPSSTGLAGHAVMPQMHSVADPPLRLAGLVPQLSRSGAKVTGLAKAAQLYRSCRSFHRFAASQMYSFHRSLSGLACLAPDRPWHSLGTAASTRPPSALHTSLKGGVCIADQQQEAESPLLARLGDGCVLTNGFGH